MIYEIMELDSLIEQIDSLKIISISDIRLKHKYIELYCRRLKREGINPIDHSDAILLQWENMSQLQRTKLVSGMAEEDQKLYCT